MAKIIDKKINKEIDNGLNLNEVIGVNQNRYDLPKFTVNEKGEYDFAGTQTITSLAEFSKYMKDYSAIANYIKQTYGSTISRIYKNALNSLIASNGRYNISKNKYSLSSKAEKTFGISKISSETTQNYEDTLNFVTKAAYKTKRLKAGNQVVYILKNANHTFNQNDRYYVLPQISDNGVVLKQKKNNSNLLEAQFELVPETDAKIVENYMLETANSLDKKTAENVKSQIVKIFSSAKRVGSKMSDAVDGKMIDELTELTANLVDLVGVDLTSFEKKSTKTSRGASENHNVAASNEKPSNDLSSAKEILIRGTFKTSPALEGDVIVTKITPEGTKFSVTFDGNKLFVANSNEKEDEAQGPQM